MKYFSKIAIFCIVLLSACSLPRSTDYVMHGFIHESKERSIEPGFQNNGISKTGIACTTNIAGFYVSGDSSLSTAMVNGGISKVSYVDKTIFAVGPFYGKVCTVVKGS